MKTFDRVGEVFQARGWLRITAIFMMLMATSACGPEISPQPYEAPPDAVSGSGRPIVFLTAAQMAEAIRMGRLTAVEVVEAHLKHIHQFNPKINAIVSIDEHAVRRQAREADAALKQGDYRGPLHGVPVTVKDHFSVNGLRNTNGMPETAEYVPDSDASVVARLKDAGAIILGKTNMPPMAMDMQTSNDIFGRTNNPWDLNRTPGGSTGGGAAAVAAGMSPLEIGSDIGGSIRQPSHFCGIYGFKATENTVSNHGSFVPLMEDFKSIRHMASNGPLARSVADLKLAYQLIAGPDGEDGMVIPPDESPLTKESIADLRIAWTNQFGDVPVSTDTKRVLREFVNKLSGRAGEIRHVSLSSIDFNRVWATWGEMMDLEVGVLQPPMTRFLIFLAGGAQRAKTPLLQMEYPAGYDDYIETVSRRDRITAQFDQLFLNWDVLICPVAPMAAFAHHLPDDQKFGYNIYKKPLLVDGRAINYWTGCASYTTPFNLTGHPVVVIPAGFSSEGVPIGLQLVAARGKDTALLEMAEMIDRLAGDYRAPEGY